MQMVDTKNIKTGAELIRHYADIKKRLYPVARKKIEIPKAATRIDPEKRGKRPLWCLMDIRFDDHVKTRERIRTAIINRDCTQHKKTDLPVWKSEATNFNHHMVTYLKAKLNEEIDSDYGIVDEKKPIREIVSDVLRFFEGITLSDLKGSSRVKRVILPRHMAMWEIRRQRNDLSFPAIGRWFGGRDHTVAIHACRKIEAMKASGDLDWYFTE